LILLLPMKTLLQKHQSNGARCYNKSRSNDRENQIASAKETIPYDQLCEQFRIKTRLNRAEQIEKSGNIADQPRGITAFYFDVQSSSRIASACSLSLRLRKRTKLDRFSRSSRSIAIPTKTSFCSLRSHSFRPVMISSDGSS